MKTIINNTKGVVTYEEGSNIVLETTGEIQIKGDVTIAGTTTTNARIDDRIIELAYGTTGSRSSGLEDAGIIIERGDDDNVFFGWDESVDLFSVGTGTFSGTSDVPLSLTLAGMNVSMLTGSISLAAPAITGSATVTVPEGGLILGSTAVTATAAEINAIAGGGLSDSELGVLNSVTAGTAAGSKAVVLDSSKDVSGINSLSATTLAGTLSTAAQTNVTSLGTLSALTVDNVAIDGTTIGHTGDTDLITLASGIVTVAGEISVTTLDIGGTNVTATAAELNYVDVTAGTAAASKALVLDSSRDIANINSLTATTLAGTLGITNLDIDGGTDIGAALVDADLIIVDDGAGGTNRKSAMSRVKTYVSDLTLTTAAQTAITSVGTLSALAVSGDLTVDTSTLKVDSSNNSVGIGTATPNSQPDEKNDLVIGDLTGNRGMTIASAGTGVGTIRFARSANANDGEGWIDYSGNTKRMRFGTNGLNTRVTIDGSGNVAIGASSPGTSSALDMGSITTKGLRLPNATDGGISTPTEGMIIYDTDTSKLMFYNGSSWETVTSV